MIKNWHLLYSTRNFAEANIIKGMLEENNVPVIIFNKQDSNYLCFGDIELFVPAVFKNIATQLLDQSLLA